MPSRRSSEAVPAQVSRDGSGFSRRRGPWKSLWLLVVLSAALAACAARGPHLAEAGSRRPDDRRDATPGVPVSTSTFMSSRASGLRSVREVGEPSPRLHDLRDVLIHAVRRNPRIRSAAESVIASRHRRPQRIVPPNPTLRLGWYAESVETRTGPQELVIGLTQRFPWPRKLALEGELADIETDMEQVRRWIVERDVLTDVATRYLEFFYAVRAADIATAIGVTYDRLFDVVTREIVGDDVDRPARARGPELVRVETLRAQVDYDRLQLTELGDVEEERLRSFLALPPATVIGPPRLPAFPFVSVDVRDKERWYEIACDVNQEVLLARLEVIRMRKSIEKARLRQAPDFSVGARYLATGRRIDADPRGNGDDPVVVELGVSLPIWAGANRAAVAEARHRVRAAAHSRDAVAARLRRNLAAALWKVRDKRRLLDLHRETLLPQARAAASASEALLREESTNISGLIETIVSRHHFELATLRAQVDYLQAIVGLEQVVGAPLTKIDRGGRE